ncbi:24902_t:CDS:2 [Dentiscutata erythropus]|uniref:24902_t:CDS:1 n=1 Tax=Dentiscutata erythropus TaxID=1348616 RepID=A0A9N9E2T1_9GLOM|nr:24902_t:CDS:2 [Dentiscutata erythropus]
MILIGFFLRNNPILNNLNGIRLEFVYDIINEASLICENSITEPWPLEKQLQYFQDHKLLTSKEKIYCMDRVCETEKKNDRMKNKNFNWLNTQCIHCQNDLTSESTCKYCVQLYLMIEWVPFTKFKNTELIAQGGFGNIYVATWIDGPRINWDGYKQSFIRDGPRRVILKSMKCSDHYEKFFREALAHISFTMQTSLIVSCHGLTKTPEQNNYMMILDYQKDGREYDEQLAKEIIINNLRPRKIHELPSDYEEIIKRCWDPNISNRPSTLELFNIFRTNLKKIYKGELNIPEPDIAHIALSTDMISRTINTEKIKEIIHTEQSSHTYTEELDLFSQIHIDN